MRRIIKVLAAAALIAIILAVGATSALAEKPDWAQPDDPPKYSWEPIPSYVRHMGLAAAMPMVRTSSL